MVQSLPTSEFLSQATEIPVIDVRAPIEFGRGSIPGATNLALFDDVERSSVGKLFKEQGRLAATLRGLEIAGPKMRGIVESTLRLLPTKRAGLRRVLVYCWRGGMRSQSVAWLLEQAEFEVCTLEGGYKAFRKHVLNSFQRPKNLLVLTGLTGSGKTKQLEHLSSLGEQVIDLESLAGHRGSAFGGIGMPQQPTVEQFENNLALAFQKCASDRRVWVEDESRKIGTVVIPDGIFSQMRSAPAVFVDIPRSARADFLGAEYSDLAPDEIENSIRKISKRLGGKMAQTALEALHRGDTTSCLSTLLDYYDKAYFRVERETVVRLLASDPGKAETAIELIRVADGLRHWHYDSQYAGG